MIHARRGRRMQPGVPRFAAPARADRARTTPSSTRVLQPSSSSSSSLFLEQLDDGLGVTTDDDSCVHGNRGIVERLLLHARIVPGIARPRKTLDESRLEERVVFATVTEVGAAVLRHDPAARRALDEAELEQVRLVDVLDR